MEKLTEYIPKSSIGNPLTCVGFGSDEKDAISKKLKLDTYFNQRSITKTSGSYYMGDNKTLYYITQYDMDKYNEYVKFSKLATGNITYHGKGRSGLIVEIPDGHEVIISTNGDNFDENWVCYKRVCYKHMGVRGWEFNANFLHYYSRPKLTKLDKRFKNLSEDVITYIKSHCVNGVEFIGNGDGNINIDELDDTLEYGALDYYNYYFFNNNDNDFNWRNVNGWSYFSKLLYFSRPKPKPFKWNKGGTAPDDKMVYIYHNHAILHISEISGIEANNQDIPWVSKEQGDALTENAPRPSSM